MSNLSAKREGILDANFRFNQDGEVKEFNTISCVLLTSVAKATILSCLPHEPRNEYEQ
jgi:hypothetical protein